MSATVVGDERWAERARRCRELAERWPFASEVLRFYEAVREVQAEAFAAALEARLSRDGAVEFAVTSVAPRVVEVALTHGPQPLAAAVLACFHQMEPARAIDAWLEGAQLEAVERFLARASVAPVLEALGERAAELCTGPRNARHCPCCGGLPQVSFFASSPEDLVTAHRYLECARCATQWPFSRLVCAACGESESAKLAVYSELGTLEVELSAAVVKPGAARSGAPASSARFPHLRIDACRTCLRYLLNVDRARDGRAVPLVDELGAIPLDLYAKELGLTKVVPNLMGF